MPAYLLSNNRTLMIKFLIVCIMVMIMIDNYEMVCTGTFIHVCILFEQHRMTD